MDTAELKTLGFYGFKSVRDLINNNYSDIPDRKGVYAVIRNTENVPEFLQRSQGGHFKGNDPTVSIEDLKSNLFPPPPSPVLLQIKSVLEKQ